jgi:hypothetical protein
MSFGFIFTRCIKKDDDNKIWITCYNNIRKFYSEPILIISDNCNKDMIQNIPLENTVVIESEFNGSAEILRYYYFYKLRPFNKAIIIHDSMMVNKKFDYANYDLKDVIFLWHFEKNKIHFPDEERELLMLTHNDDIIKLYESHIWVGSLGGTSFITYEFVKLLQDKFNFLEYVNYLCLRREYRHSFERTFSVLCWYLSESIREKPSLFGSLYAPNMPIVYGMENYDGYVTDAPLIKVM